MDTKFQTSFIPKKPILSEQTIIRHSAGTSVFMFVSIIVFVVSVGSAGLSVVWKNILMKQQDGYRVELKKAEKKFDVALIEKLKKANTKIDLTNKLLKKHIAATEAFSIISQLTSDGVRFKSFEFSSSPDSNDDVKLTLIGEGVSLSAIAWQSDVLGQSTSYGTNKLLKNPILSDLILDTSGSVGFSLSASLSPDEIFYEKLLEQQASTTGQ